MTREPGLPLTTGEGNTDEVEGTVPSSWLIAEKAARQRAEAECGRLRERLAEQEALAEARKQSRRLYREQLDALTEAANAVVAFHAPPVKSDDEVSRPLVRLRAALGVEGRDD